jgi:hypothetical protein
VNNIQKIILHFLWDCIGKGVLLQMLSFLGFHCACVLNSCVAQKTVLKVVFDSCDTKTRGCIQKFPDRVDNEINSNKHSLRSNTKGYGGKTHLTDSQNSDTTAPSGRELYHLQFSLQSASPETFEYTIVVTVN